MFTFCRNKKNGSKNKEKKEKAKKVIVTTSRDSQNLDNNEIYAKRFKRYIC